jgi:hypothetical protein
MAEFLLGSRVRLKIGSEILSLRLSFWTATNRYKLSEKLWQQSPMPVQGELPLQTYHSHANRVQARLEVLKLYAQGWGKRSISQFLHVSRPTVDRWIERFEAEHLAGLAEKSRAPTVPARKVWLPLMIDVYHLQKRHPDAGRFRIWSLLARPDISERTVGRVMALNSIRSGSENRDHAAACTC